MCLPRSMTSPCQLLQVQSRRRSWLMFLPSSLLTGLAAAGAITEQEVKVQIYALLGAGLALAYTLDRWAGHDNPVILELTIFGSFISYIYSAPPLKLKQTGWAGSYALGSSYIALPWWAGQVCPPSPPSLPPSPFWFELQSLSPGGLVRSAPTPPLLSLVAPPILLYPGGLPRSAPPPPFLSLLAHPTLLFTSGLARSAPPPPLPVLLCLLAHPTLLSGGGPARSAPPPPRPPSPPHPALCTLLSPGLAGLARLPSWPPLRPFDLPASIESCCSSLAACKPGASSLEALTLSLFDEAQGHG